MAFTFRKRLLLNFILQSLTSLIQYHDDEYEFLHVIMPPDLVNIMDRERLMTEADWRKLGFKKLIKLAEEGYILFVINFYKISIRIIEILSIVPYIYSLVKNINRIVIEYLIVIGSEVVFTSA